MGTSIDDLGKTPQIGIPLLGMMSHNGVWFDRTTIVIVNHTIQVYYVW